MLTPLDSSRPPPTTSEQTTCSSYPTQLVLERCCLPSGSSASSPEICSLTFAAAASASPLVDEFVIADGGGRSCSARERDRSEGVRLIELVRAWRPPDDMVEEGVRVG